MTTLTIIIKGDAAAEQAVARNIVNTLDNRLVFINSNVATKGLIDSITATYNRVTVVKDVSVALAKDVTTGDLVKLP